MLLAAVAPCRLGADGGPSHRRIPLSVPSDGRPGFERLDAPGIGITITNRLSPEAAAHNQILLDGSGVAAGDFDGDGRCDLYFCTLTDGNRLYRNLGNWRFEDVTATAGVGCPGQSSTGAVFADIDGDGDLDLLVNALGQGTRCFVNQGGGRFVERTDAGLQRGLGSHSLALADVDGDGDLDLYVTNYRTTTVRDNPLPVKVRQTKGQLTVDPAYADRFLVFSPAPGRASLIELGEPDVLYLNDGTGRFQMQSWTNGTFLDEQRRPLGRAPLDWGLSAMFRDLDGDGTPDLYVCNDFASPDRIWMNDGHGHFHALPPGRIRHTSWASMAMDVADIDRDGRDDFFVSDMLSQDLRNRRIQRGNARPGLQPEDEANDRPQHQHNTLFWNRGDGTYAEIAFQAGVEASEWTWGSVFLDVDLDGYEDLLLANGHAYDMQDIDAAARIAALRRGAGKQAGSLLTTNFPVLSTRNVAFRNRHDLTFEDASQRWHFDRAGISHGVVLADLDGDGDLDVVTSDLNQTPGIYRNESPAPRLAVRLRGLPPNTRGIGARIRLEAPGLVQSQEMICGGRYLSGDDSMRVFAASWTNGSHAALEVRWRSGRRTRIENVERDSLYEVFEEGATAGAFPSVADTTPGPFQFTAGSVSHSKEPALPPRAETLQAWHPLPPHARSTLLLRVDFDHDGWDDLVDIRGESRSWQILTNTHHGELRPMKLPESWDLLKPIGPAVVWRPDASGDRLLLAVEGAKAGSSRLVELRVADDGFHAANAVESLETWVGALALADVAGDGHLDLLVAGGTKPGHFPEDAPSFLFRQNQGRWVAHPDSRSWSGVGGVGTALFADLDHDGFPELVLGGSWGPLRVFVNERGHLKELPADAMPRLRKGAWNSLAAVDLDEDGSLQVVATGWGRNHAWQRFLGHPVRLHATDPEHTGTPTLVEAVRPPGSDGWFPTRDLRDFRETLPSLASAFATFAEFADASADRILAADATSHADIDTLDSVVLRLRGGRVEAQPLPTEAQMSPALGIATGDFDGDGHEDLFVGQNAAHLGSDPGRLDGGRGLLLCGDGHGGLVPARNTGVAMDVEMGAATRFDLRHDGGDDIAVQCAGGVVRFFAHAGPRGNLRVAFQGPPGNPAGIGASIRWLRGVAAHGPARIAPGNGDVVVPADPMATNGAPKRLEVTWPGGLRQVLVVPTNALEATVAWPSR